MPAQTPRLFAALIFVLITCICQAQTATLKGQVVDNNNAPVSGAAIRITKLSDKTHVTGAFANEAGAFRVNRIPLRDSLLIEISSLGYKIFRTKLFLKESSITLESITLTEDITQLEDVEITGERPAMITHGDTIEYRAASFETPPFAEAGELINRLPGLRRDQNGALTFNGIPIVKILVNGQEYFGKDGEVALSKIPADMIEKIEVINNPEIAPGKKPDEEKVLNIKLYDNARRFGNVMAGIGTDKRYEASGTLTFMGDESQFSIMSSANNINSQGSPSAISSTSSGIRESAGGGININKKLSKKVSINGSAGYNRGYSLTQSLRSREQFLIPDSSFFTNSNNTARNWSDNITLIAGSQIQLDSITTLIAEMSGINFSATDSETASSTQTLDEAGAEVNNLKSTYRADGNRVAIPLSVRFSRRYSKTSRLTLGFTSNFDRQTSNDLNLATTTFRNINGGDSVSQTNQQIIRNNRSASYNVSIGYSFKLFKDFSMSVNNNLSIRQAKNQTDTWKLDEAQERIGLDTLYSNFFRSLTVSNNTGTSVHYNKKKFSASLGIMMNYFNSQQRDESRDTTIYQNTFNASPNIQIGYRFSEKKQMHFNYSATVSPPQLQQLQPVVNNTNPLIIQRGNPDLKPVFSQQMGMNYQVYNDKGTSLNAGVNLNPISNKIIQTIQIDKSGKQIMSYENVNGVFYLSGALGFGMQKRREEQTVDFSFNGNVSYSQDKNFINQQLATNRFIQASPSVSAGYNWKSNLSLNLSYGPSFTVSRYEYASSQNQQFMIHYLSTSMNVYAFKKLIFKSFIRFTHNGSLPDNFTRTTTFWNCELSYVVIKKLEFKLRVYDLLRQSQNISRIANQNFIESSQTNNLQQYFMFGLRYHMR